VVNTKKSMGIDVNHSHGDVIGHEAAISNANFQTTISKLINIGEPAIDAIYPLLLRPVLFQLDPERVHDLAVFALRTLSTRPWLIRLARLFTECSDPITVMGMVFPNRVGTAGGLDENGVAIPAWWAIGFGFAEIGTVTPLPQDGNPKLRLFRYPDRRAILNCMGFNNHGAEIVARNLAARWKSSRMPIGVSIGKQAKTMENDLPAVVDDYTASATTLAPQADFMTINVSSPNTTGLRTLQKPESLAVLVATVKKVIGGKPLLVKVAPELEGDALAATVNAVLSHGAAGLIATNTLEQSRDGKVIGGLSGRPLRDISPRRVEAIRALAPNAAIIGCGGIDDVASARRMIDAGADLIQVYSGMIYEGPLLIGRLARGLRRHKPAQ
jgi:dihydroorotate dehydrogenase